MSTPSTPPADDPLMRETIDGRYRIVGVLGRGGMGAVYEAHAVRTDARVAVKVLLGGEAQDLPSLQRFDREARAPSRVRHPSVVPVLDAGYDPRLKVHFIVQELLSGETLSQRLRRERPMRPERALAIITPVMEALAAAHAQRVIHRDIKPANIFLCDDAHGERPMVIDFGIARILPVDGDAEGLTRDGTMLGSFSYMAPEQARGEVSTLDARTDIWSVGVLLYEMLSGSRPFEGENPLAIVRRILNDDPTPIGARVPGIPPAIESAVTRALRKLPAERFQTMDAFLAALGAAECELQATTQWSPPQRLASAPPTEHLAPSVSASVPPVMRSISGRSASSATWLIVATVALGLSWLVVTAVARTRRPMHAPHAVASPPPTATAPPISAHIEIAPGPAPPAFQVLAAPAVPPAVPPTVAAPSAARVAAPSSAQARHPMRQRRRPPRDPWMIEE